MNPEALLLGTLGVIIIAVLVYKASRYASPPAADAPCDCDAECYCPPGNGEIRFNWILGIAFALFLVGAVYVSKKSDKELIESGLTEIGLDGKPLTEEWRCTEKTLGSPRTFECIVKGSSISLTIFAPDETSNEWRVCQPVSSTKMVCQSGDKIAAKYRKFFW